MWLIKGALLGCTLFGLGTAVFLVFTLPPFQPNRAIGLSALAGSTAMNPFFYVALLSCLALGISLVGSWPIRIQH